MWSFRSRKELPGLTRHKDGKLSFRFTHDEEQAINEQVELCKGYYVHKSLYQKFEKSLIGRGLFCYAKSQSMRASLASHNKSECMEKAIAAISKAYNFHQLPIYLYDLASFTAMANYHSSSKNIFRLFLERQADFKPDQMDEIAMQDRDIQEAIRDAKSRLA